jgi:hypothetical protein
MNRMANSSSDVAMTLGKLPVVGEAVPDFELPDSLAVPRRLFASVTPDPLVLLNRREMGGIGKPAVFIIGNDLTVRYVSLDTVSMRVPASETLRILRSTGSVRPARRRLYIPTPAGFLRDIKNLLRFSPHSRRKH